MNSTDIIGKTFGNLEVLNFEYSKKVGKKNPVSKRFYKVKCSCGTEKIVCKENLTSGTTTSCGCLARKLVKERNATKRLPDNASLWNLGYKSHLKDARIRGYSSELTLDSYKELASKNCYYCNSSPTKRTHPNLYGEIYRNGVDRIDSSKDYTLDNIRPCCGTCNYMKLDMSEEQFYKHIKRIYECSEGSPVDCKGN